MDPIAIIGIGCRFPNAKNPKSFWQLLRNGIDAITEVPPERWDVDAYYAPEAATPGKMNTRWGGFLEQVDQFEPSFFGISPREVERMDPQHRLVLEVAWEALENAAIVPSQLAGSQTGIFIGISSHSDYSRLLCKDFLSLNAYNGTGTSFCIAANRISYLLDLKGPSVAIDTACSSSLVATHFACQSLQRGESNLCLVGGVNLILSPEINIVFSQARMMAADGRCKTFDGSADGYVRGEGCGIVVLKRLSDALRDGDNIQAIIRGSAVNQDGLTNGLTAPNGPSQQAVIRQALENAGVASAQISYVEAHGTGTPLGDPIEFKSLKSVLMQGRSPEQPCWIGSVKTNIGHLEAAAGIASLLKVVLSLQHQEIPPHLHLNRLNQYISLQGTSFSIPTECQSWSADGDHRLAGVSAFGFGGTNCHVIVEEAPGADETRQGHKETVERPLHLLTLSAKNEKALKELAQSYSNYLKSETTTSLGDVCFTANTGRTHFESRLAVVAQSPTQLQEKLAGFQIGQENSGLLSGKVANKKSPKIAFLFTGQGSQYIGMGHQLYKTQPIFRDFIERCQEILRPYLEKSLLEVLALAEGAEDASFNLLNETVYTQPALFALEYALAKVWQSWGIKPSAVMGHSVGEYVAACIAGVFSLEDGLKLIAQRARLMQALPQEGEMVVVFADEKQVAEAIQDYSKEVGIAALNGPQNIVISGQRQALKAVLIHLRAEGIKTKKLTVSHAFHSPLMEPMLDEFKQVAKAIAYSKPRLSLISNLTGKPVTSEIATPEYWCRHILEPVRFAASLETLVQQGYEVFLEIGPKPILLGMGRSCLPNPEKLWLPSLRQGREDWQQMLESLSALYLQGASIDWSGFERDHSRCRIPLPTYPFQRQQYWLETAQNPLAQAVEALDEWEFIVEAGRYQAQQGPFDLGLHQYSTQLQALERLITAYILQTLQKLGIYRQQNESYSVDTVLSKLNILPAYRKTVTQFLKRLANAGLVREEADAFIAVTLPPSSFTDSLLQELRNQTPQQQFLLDFIERCGENLDQVLLGQINPVDLLFPGGSFETAEGIYQHSPEARYFNNIAKALLESFIKTLPQNKPLRVLEIGAGTGSTTAFLLPVLPANRATYWSTDLSELFLLRAKHKFKTCRFINFGLLNIEQNPQEQGYELNSFDVVVAANVLHATHNLEQTLQHAYSLVAPGGLLLLWEITYPHAWLDITFGLFEGWHRYNDSLRQNTPLLERQQWEEALLAHGFESVVALPEQESAAAILGQNMLIARKAVSDICKHEVSVGERPLIAQTTLSKTLAKTELSFTPTQLLAAEPDERQQMFKVYINHLLVKITRIPATELDWRQNLSSLGIDSLMSTELRQQIEADLNITVPVEYFAALSIDQFCQQILLLVDAQSPILEKQSLDDEPAVDAGLKPEVNPWFPHLTTTLKPQAYLRLFCFPYAGAGASIFHSWLKELPSEIELCPIQLPGRENRGLEPLFTRLKPLIQALAPIIRPQLEIPFAFFGHSLGALLAFELTRELRRRNWNCPAHLFVSGSRAPQIPDWDAPIHSLPEPKFKEALKRLKGTPEEVLQNAELMRLYMPALRADFALLETYFYAVEDPLNCPISCFGGLQDHKVSHDTLAAWEAQTNRHFTLQMFPGEHFFLHGARTSLVQVIAQELRKLLILK